MKKVILLIAVTCSISCTSYKPLAKKLKKQLDTSVFDHQFVGLFLYDPVSGDTLINYNGEKYFTPASNTKIFTLFTSMRLLPETLPSLQYLTANGNTYVRGVGNPASLHPKLKDSSLVEFLKNQHNLHLYYNNLVDAPMGPGWSWDDFDTYYSAQRSSLPLYGNIVRIYQGDTLFVSPKLLKDSVRHKDTPYRRALASNQFYLPTSLKDSIEVPYIADSTLIRKLLENASGKSIKISENFPAGEVKTIYGIAADSLYKQLMQHSDNFIAEQLLIMASATLGDTLNSAKARSYILENDLASLKQKPRWVDGSGLSRYNLFTPASLVFVLNELYRTVPKSKLYTYFPTAGVSGTLKHYFKGNPNPYIHAKTGSLSNNYCLSGYLETSSGKTLIFSYMNNHYRQSSTILKQQMTPILEWIRDHY